MSLTLRACLAPLGVQEEATRLAAKVQDRDGVDLQKADFVLAEHRNGPTNRSPSRINCTCRDSPTRQDDVREL
jgi:hypothetical protein